MGKLKIYSPTKKNYQMDFTTRYSLVWLFMLITEYGHRPFVEGFIEDFTDPLLITFLLEWV